MWCFCVRAREQPRRSARAGIRHGATAASSSPPLRPAARASAVSSSGGGGGRPVRVGGAPRGGGQPQGVAGGAGGGGCRGAAPAPPLPRAQLQLPDRLKGWRIVVLLLLNLLTARFEAEFVDSFLVPLLLSSL